MGFAIALFLDGLTLGYGAASILSSLRSQGVWQPLAHLAKADCFLSQVVLAENFPVTSSHTQQKRFFMDGCVACQSWLVGKCHLSAVRAAFQLLFFLPISRGRRACGPAQRFPLMPRQREWLRGQKVKGEWVQLTRERLQKEEHYTEASTGRDSRARWAEAEKEAQIEEESQHAAGDGASRPPLTLTRQQALETAYRHLLEGAALRLASFTPTVHTTIVLGRPVQVAPTQDPPPLTQMSSCVMG